MTIEEKKLDSPTPQDVYDLAVLLYGDGVRLDMIEHSHMHATEYSCDGRAVLVFGNEGNFLDARGSDVSTALMELYVKLRSLLSEQRLALLNTELEKHIPT